MAADNFNDRLVLLYSWIKRQAYRYCSNEYDAEDLASETIYKLLRYRDKFDNKRDLKPWILSIMQNTYITDYYHRRCIAFVEVEDNMLTYSYSEPQSLISIKNIVSIVRQYARQSCCIESVLLYAKGYNYDEISRILDIPIGTVRSRISSGRKLLKEALEL